MELIDKVRRILKEEYGISSDQELMKAIEEQKRPDIGIFVSPCGTEMDEAKAS